MSTKKFAEENISLGKNVKQARKSKGYTLKKLGEKIGVSPGFLSEVESGKKMPGGEVLYSLKRNLDVSIDSLFRFYELVGGEDLAAEEKNKYQKVECINAPTDLLREKTERITNLEHQIAGLEADKRRQNKQIDKLYEQIDDLKRELSTLEKSSSSA